MNNDRKLLELAAKAAGMVIRWNYKREQFFYDYCDGLTDEWNPLTDDGDALRLAVKLELIVSTWDCDMAVWHPDMDIAITEPIVTDRLAAIRRAITRAAAEIGKEMP